MENWSQDMTIQLIDEYRLRPVLWDCKIKEYKDRNKRHDSLMELSTLFKEEKLEIEKKIKNL